MGTTYGVLWGFVTGGGEAAVLWWEAPEEPLEFRVYRHEFGAEAWARIDTKSPSWDGMHRAYTYTDRSIPGGGKYEYRVGVVRDGQETFPFAPIVVEIPTFLRLDYATPGVLAPGLHIRYELPASGKVSLLIFDSAGRRVRTLVSMTSTRGWHEVEWNGRNDAGREVSRGVYFYELRFGSERVRSKAVLVR